MEAKPLLGSSHNPSIPNRSNLATTGEQEKPRMVTIGRVVDDQSDRKRRKFGNALTLCLSAIVFHDTSLVLDDVLYYNSGPPMFALMMSALCISEQKDHKELISLVRSSSSSLTAQPDASYYFTSQHKRKLRSLAPGPVNDQLFVTR